MRITKLYHKKSYLITVLFLIIIVSTYTSHNANAEIPSSGPGVSSCGSLAATCTPGESGQCGSCVRDITDMHETIQEHVSTAAQDHREWIVVDFFELAQIAQTMGLMADQLTTIGIQQIEIIGTFFDAKHQLETQRLFQTLVAQAHKDYHPSEGICEIGTATRSLAASERLANLNQIAFSNRMMQRQILSADVLSGEGARSDRESRLLQFRTVFCNPADNAGNLELLCGAGGITEQYNMDVDYTNTIENKLTLDIDFTAPGSPPPTPDEENVFALSANLFSNEVLSSVTEQLLASPDHRPRDLSNFYIRQRAIAAKRSVAQNSFSAITAMRGLGSGENAPFLKSVIQELGVGSNAINPYIGTSPSYFAQMEILTKKLYQNPEFYANLYDKPANIERKGAALQAIAIMQDRDIYKSLLRSEAVLATMLETLMSKEHNRISRDLDTLKDSEERL